MNEANKAHLITDLAFRSSGSKHSPLTLSIFICTEQEDTIKTVLGAFDPKLACVSGSRSLWAKRKHFIDVLKIAEKKVIAGLGESGEARISWLSWDSWVGSKSKRFYLVLWHERFWCKNYHFFTRATMTFKKKRHKIVCNTENVLFFLCKYTSEKYSKS